MDLFHKPNTIQTDVLFISRGSDLAIPAHKIDIIIEYQKDCRYSTNVLEVALKENRVIKTFTNNNDIKTLVCLQDGYVIPSKVQYTTLKKRCNKIIPTITIITGEAQVAINTAKICILFDIDSISSDTILLFKKHSIYTDIKMDKIKSAIGLYNNNDNKKYTLIPSTFNLHTIKERISRKQIEAK